MKTTDLIPIILYQLKDGDRYGYEIIKQIEDSSAGKIIIKQPTLYSVLKKLEQNKFISSYWQDSEIGGKRHYYKLTANGISQLSTYPDLQQLITDALDEEIISPTVTNSEPISDVSSKVLEPSPAVASKMENTEPIISPIKIDLTSPTGLAATYDDFQSNVESLDDNEAVYTATSSVSVFDAMEPAADIEKPESSVNIFDMMEPAESTQTNSSPISIFDAIGAEDVESTEPIFINEATPGLDNSTINEDYQAEESEVVTAELEVETIELQSKLVDKVDANPAAFVSIDDNPSNPEESITEDYSPIEQVRYLNYIDLSTDEKSCSRRKVVSKHVQKMLFTCSSILLMFILTFVVCSKYSFGKIYYICAIAGVLTMILYPIILFKDISKLRLKYCKTPFRYSLFQDLFIKLSTFLSIVIATFAYNVSTTSNITNIFKMTNFANLYAPIMFASIFVIDLMVGIALYKDYRVKK